MQFGRVKPAMAARTRAPDLPSPEVRFSPDFPARLGRLAARLASLRERREGAGAARFLGVGSEFVGYRPYGRGEDLRMLDWNLLARLGRPWVRMAAREASERWAVLVDISASMGVGRPGKLQLAAEVATAFAGLGLERRATVELSISGRDERLLARRRQDLAAWMRRLEESRAGGEAGLAALLSGRRLREAGRVVLIGDLLDLEPKDVLAWGRSTRELVLCQILAHEELVPEAGRAVRWVDAESGAARSLFVDAAACASYERRIGRKIEGWRAAASRARAVHGVFVSGTPFESVVQGLST
jgi:uncharacterized protein (DUF58 family)